MKTHRMILINVGVKKTKVAARAYTPESELVLVDSLE